jgi:hypothetical protein
VRLSAKARIAAIGALIAGVIAAVVLDQVGPSASIDVSTVRAPAGAGVWGCAVAAVGSQGGYVQLVNTAPEPSHVRLTWVRPPQKPVVSPVVVPPERAVAFRSPPSPPGGLSAEVEWSGGDIAVSVSGTTTTLLRRTSTFGSGCSRPSDAALVMPALSTLANADAAIVVANPSNADAVADVSFVVDGDQTQPENTRGRVVPAHSRIVIDAGDFVFDKAHFAAVVSPTTGSVVAAAVASTPTGVDVVPAAAPLTSGVAVGQPSRGSRLEIVAIGDDPATVDAATITGAARSATIGFPPTLDPDGPASIVLPLAGPVAVQLLERSGAPLAAALSWALPVTHGGDVAVVPAVPAAARWAFVVGPPLAAAAHAGLVLANPGDRPVVVKIRLFTPNAEVDSPNLQALTVLPGRVVSLPLGVANALPVGAEITTDGSPVAAVMVGAEGSGIASTVFAIEGSSSTPVGEVAIETQPRAGVDAR